MTAAMLIADPVVTAACSAAAALVLLLSVLPKLREFERFHAAFGVYGLLPSAWSRVASMAFVAAETGAALLLVVRPLHPLSAVAGLAVVGLATAAVVINLAHGRRDIRCGCGSDADSMPLSAGLVLRNLALLAVLATAAASAATAPARALAALDFAAAGFCALALLLMWLAATQLLANADRARTRA
uniref:MauE/DoxX family redox-associated membrane protein n=1 Tax=Cupriavidus necator TaxID=106590 RepID=UPI003F49A608